MKTREEILGILAQHRAELAQRFMVRSIALFGSYARGDQVPGSDVDILVEVDPGIGLRFVSLAERIESLLGMKVDLVSRGAVKPKQWELIQRDLRHV